ncbi:MAG: type II toxin-antitoxin system VapC family toxin [Gemmatimonadota bacterium]|nr:MAG: type II toxin-antitoxin system VapC family toxin [Gemmatimonadota bacterium]
MKYLIDTHTLLWILTDDSRLSKKAKRYYLDPQNEILFSMAGIWELAIKSSLGRLSLEKSLEEFVMKHIKGNDIGILHIELPHVLRVEQLPFHHRDPFDRLLISQSIENDLPIISSDKTLDRYRIQRIW